MIERRRGLMSSVKGGLPSAYQQVEWIASSGSQAMDTGILFLTSTEIRCGYQFISNPSNYSMGYGCASPSLGIAKSSNAPTNWYSSYGNQTDKSFSITGGLGDAIHDIIHNKDGFWVDETKKVSYTNAVVDETKQRKIALFCRFSSSNSHERKQSCRFSYFQIMQNGVAVRNFIPCYRKADSIIGMYDTVSKTFFTNEGTGTFTKGADV